MFNKKKKTNMKRNGNKGISSFMAIDKEVCDILIIKMQNNKMNFERERHEDKKVIESEK